MNSLNPNDTDSDFFRAFLKGMFLYNALFIGFCSYFLDIHISQYADRFPFIISGCIFTQLVRIFQSPNSKKGC